MTLGERKHAVGETNQHQTGPTMPRHPQARPRADGTANQSPRAYVPERERAQEGYLRTMRYTALLYSQDV